MKKIRIAILAVALIFAIVVAAADLMTPGMHYGAMPNGATATGAVLVSSVASTSTVVYAVYDLGSKAYTNQIYSLTTSGGYAETNGTQRLIAPGAAIYVVGAPVYLFLK